MEARSKALQTASTTTKKKRSREWTMDTMEVEATIEDSKVLTKSWVVPKQTLRLATFDQILALDCTGVESAALMEAASKINYGKK